VSLLLSSRLISFSLPPQVCFFHLFGVCSCFSVSSLFFACTSLVLRWALLSCLPSPVDSSLIFMGFLSWLLVAYCISSVSLLTLLCWCPFRLFYMVCSLSLAGDSPCSASGSGDSLSIEVILLQLEGISFALGRRQLFSSIVVVCSSISVSSSRICAKDSGLGSSFSLRLLSPPFGLR